MPRSRSVAATIVALTAFVLTCLFTNPAAGTAAEEYVALGDSYASGVGTRTYHSDGSGCLRSPAAYPVLDAARLGAQLSFAACSGARTSDVLNTQLTQLDADTEWVTITVGGNDAGFSSVLTECAQPWWSSNCDAAIDKARTFIRGTLPARLDQVYAAVRQGAPTARAVVVGYPRLFNGEDCNAGTWFSPTEMTRLNDTADLLNSTTRGRATAAGFGFANPTASFVGHAVCADVEWVNGLSNPVRESYHPNKAGQIGYADLVEDALTS